MHHSVGGCRSSVSTEYELNFNVLGAIMVRDVACCMLSLVEDQFSTGAFWSICRSLTLLAGRPVAVVEQMDDQGYWILRDEPRVI